MTIPLVSPEELERAAPGVYRVARDVGDGFLYEIVERHSLYWADLDQVTETDVRKIARVTTRTVGESTLGVERCYRGDGLMILYGWERVAPREARRSDH